MTNDIDNPTAGLIDEADDLEQAKLQAEERAFLQLVELYRIRAAEHYSDKEYLLERDGIGFAPRGNVCALTAEKKAGKSWFAMAMCAAYLSGSYLGMRSRVAEGYTPHVLYFDTEQDQGDGQRIQKRVHTACNWDWEIDNDQFQIFHLREIPAEERSAFICQAIEKLPCDLVIVDGIRDLLSDFNDLEQSAHVIQDHMRLSSEHNCCIWDVLHVNPNSEKMRGHLGTELGNKVADILFMTKNKDKDNEDNTTYKMEETDARSHKDIHSITFRIDDERPYGAPVMLSESEVQAIDENRVNELRTIMEKYIPENAAWSKTKIQQMLCNGEHYGGKKAWTVIDEAIGSKVLELTVGNKFRVRHSDDALNTTQSEIPF